MNKQDITNLINSTIIDNDNGLITAETMRDVLNAINDYEPPIADELGRGDNAISQKTVTEEFDKVNTNIETLSTNVNLQVQELSDEVEGKVIEIDGKIKEFSDEVDSEIDRLNQNVQDSLDSYLPINGGKMKGDIDMQGNKINNIGIEEVESLPTTNLYEGRMVKFKNKTYTFYNGLWLALSDDLRGHTNDTHEEEFIYQPTASDLSIKDGYADIKRIKGNAIVWNQKFINKDLISSGVNITTSKDVLILNGTLNTTYLGLTNLDIAKIPLNHIGYYRIVILKDYSNILQNKYFALLNRSVVCKITQNTAKFLYQSTDDSLRWNLGFRGFSGGEVFEDIQIKVNVFDLTQMFGEGNEPTIEEFEAMFPNDYYEYNKGELMSFDGKGVKSVGFNQWDGVLELGYILDNGNNANSNNKVRTNYIKVLPNTTYYVSSNSNTEASIFIFMYDNNKVFLRKKNAIYKGTKFAIDADVHYIRFYYYDTTPSNVYNICINLSHSGYRNGEYEPYEDYTLSFQDGKTISQLTGKLNGEGESVTIFPDGLRSAGEAFDEIVYDEVTGKHKAIKRIGKRSYMTGDEADTNVITDNTNTYYELAEPEIYKLDSIITTSYEAYDFGTEEVLYNEENAVNIPMKADIEYGFNAVDMIRSNFAEIKALKERVTALEQAILQIQAANTANEQIE